MENTSYNVKGGFYFSKFNLFDPNIKIDITLSSEFSKLDFDKLYGRVFNALKHELSHYYQYRTNRESLETGFQEQDVGNSFLESCVLISEYILSDVELEPYVKGLVYQSKKLNRSFISVLNDNLDLLFFQHTNKNDILESAFGRQVTEIIEKIKLAVIDGAKQLYPYLRRTL